MLSQSISNNTLSQNEMTTILEAKNEVGRISYDWLDEDNTPIRSLYHAVIQNEMSVIDDLVKAQWNSVWNNHVVINEAAWAAFRGELVDLYLIENDNEVRIKIGKIADGNLLANFLIILKTRLQSYIHMFYQNNPRLFHLINSMNDDNFALLIKAILLSYTKNTSTLAINLIGRVGNKTALETLIKDFKTTDNKTAKNTLLLTRRVSELQISGDNLLPENHELVSKIRAKHALKNIPLLPAEKLTLNYLWPKPKDVKHQTSTNEASQKKRKRNQAQESTLSEEYLNAVEHPDILLETTLPLISWPQTPSVEVDEIWTEPFSPVFSIEGFFATDDSINEQYESDNSIIPKSNI